MDGSRAPAGGGGPLVDLWADPDFVRDEMEAEPRPRPAPLPALKLPPGMVWRAGRDGIGHLLPKSVAYVRYLCNRIPIPDRFAWPRTSDCAHCVAVLEGREVATAP